MKLTLVLVATLLCINISLALSQTWEYARHIGGMNNDYASQVVTDREANSYVIGEFFDTTIIDTATLSVPKRWSVFIAKYNQSGSLIWARVVASGIDSTADMYANGLTLDSTGNIYVAGSFFTGGVFSATTLESIGPSDIYLAKLNSEGNLLWVRRAGGVGVGTFGKDEARSIGVDAAGNCYLTGSYNKDAMFDSIALSSTTTVEMFVAKYDADGKALWAITGSSPSFSHLGLAIAVDVSGNSYVTGSFFNTLTLGDYTVDAIDAEQKMFVAKLSPDGSVLWAHKVGTGGYYGAGLSIAIDKGGSSYIAGYFRADIHFSDTSYATSNGLAYAVLVVKYDRDGNLLWATRSDGADESATGRRIALDATGTSFIVGSFSSSITFGSTTLVAQKNDAFIATLNPQGRFVGARQIGGAGNEAGSGVATTSVGNCVVIGTFEDSIHVDTTDLISRGRQDIFLARFREKILTVGGDDVQHIERLPFYPNPVRDILILDKSLSHRPIQILSMTGERIFDAGSAERIDVRDLATGLYFLRIGHSYYQFAKIP
jgi:hypothetical protein